MANETDFNHDQLGHLLGDRLLEVPRFQRAYSWEREHVDAYLADLSRARDRMDSYFMGTAVFAHPAIKGGRLQIVDGQQRLATTAVFLIAIRDVLHEFGKTAQAENLHKEYLKGYVLSEEAEVERLILSPKDVPTYNLLLERKRDEADDDHLLASCYDACREHLAKITTEAHEYGLIMDISAQLADRVQVLVAVATDLPEAYVIFETLNDRGADLTTADLLKNFLFSKAGPHMRFFEESWVALEGKFDKAEELVKFIRFEYMSRKGAVQLRRLYRVIQEDLDQPGASARKYLERLLRAQVFYAAIKNPDDGFWSGQEVDVRDALLAYRRFRFESSIPTLLAAFSNWTKPNASKLLVKIAKWSVRAQFDGRIGGQLSEDAFGNASVAISDGSATNQSKVRAHLARLIPTDGVFKAAFVSYGSIPSPRAKYVLAMLDRAKAVKLGSTPKGLDWASTGFNIEHIHPQSAVGGSAEIADLVGAIGNLAILEKRLNRGLGSKPIKSKGPVYAQSDFLLTAELGTSTSWTVADIEKRTARLAELACSAWPAH